MIKLAQLNCLNLPNIAFHVCDYEDAINFVSFDCAVIYDALHHALYEEKVIRNVYNSLIDGGTFITIEPGRGHSQTEDSLETMKKYGTPEKDMPFLWQKQLMKEAGFSSVEQYIKLSELPLEDISSSTGTSLQTEHFNALSANTCHEGFTSIVVAIK